MPMKRDISRIMESLPFKIDIPKEEEIEVELDDPQANAVRKAFQNMSKDDQDHYISSLTEQEARWMYSHPDIFLFDKQIILGSDWMFYLLRCGRGFGKSHAGAAWIAKKIREGAKVLGICGPTYDDVDKVMVPFILDWFIADELDENPYVNYEIRFKNGARIHCYSSEVEKKGQNLEGLWCDEVATWCKGIPEKIKERYDDMIRSVRIGKKPQVVISSTPKNHPFFVTFQDKINKKHNNYRMMQGSMFDNPSLSDDYIISQIEEHALSSRGRQEIFGDLITETPGAYWTYDSIDKYRVNSLPSDPRYKPSNPKALTNAQLMGKAPIVLIEKDIPYLIRTVIGFDPAGSSDGDECGIIMASLYSNGHAYVREDDSGSYNPHEYANIISKRYIENHVAAVIVESNYGGKETFKYVLRSVNANMNVIPIPSKQGKTTRAEHISALYSLGKVHHVKYFKELEDQMCKFNVHYSKSPDRLDALGFCLTELFWPSNGAGGFSKASKRRITNLPGR
jgi:phage terminase large subunit-like protein